MPAGFTSPPPAGSLVSISSLCQPRLLGKAGGGLCHRQADRQAEGPGRDSVTALNPCAQQREWGRGLSPGPFFLHYQPPFLWGPRGAPTEALDVSSRARAQALSLLPGGSIPEAAGEGHVTATFPRTGPGPASPEGRDQHEEPVASSSPGPGLQGATARPLLPADLLGGFLCSLLSEVHPSLRPMPPGAHRLVRSWQ